MHTEFALIFAPQDMMLIFAIGFLLFGPKRLPEMGEALGKTVRAFREGTTKMMDELSKETRASSHREELPTQQPLDQAAIGETANERHPNLVLPDPNHVPAEAIQAPAEPKAIEAPPHVEVVHGEVIPEETAAAHHEQAEILKA